MSVSPVRRAAARKVRPQLGLVCQTASQECRFRTITRSRFLAMNVREQERELTELYWDNLSRMHWTLCYCARHGIRLFRVNSDLFPMSEDATGQSVLAGMKANLSAIGRRAESLGIRLLLHPDQFVVLNSESPRVVQNSIAVLETQARWFDLFGLPRSPWAAMNIHGGKGGRADELVAAIRALPDNVRLRLTLENDERTYGAADILDICRRAKVPMVFDNHHHAVKEGLSSYDDPGVAEMIAEARTTWPRPEWQIVHLSNGSEFFNDPRHSELITQLPRAYREAPWIEVEAKGKEQAIERLRADHPTVFGI